jgi:pimeloyl-ACP methyl ester carboxylesterase
MLNWYRASPLRPTCDGALYAALRERAADFRVLVPTLVVWGERDPALLPGLLNGLDEFVPQLRIERVAQGTHWVAQEFPREVHAAIRRFAG